MAAMKTCLFLVAALGFAACSPSGDTSPVVSITDSLPSSVKLAGVSALFDANSLVEPIKEVDCTLSGGTETRCLSVTLKPEPAYFQIGPWCPRNISDSADVSGIWLEGGKIYDVDGDFIQALPTFYQDKAWQLFDPDTGKINVTDSQLPCAAAARPDVDPQYQNHCVECQVSYMEAGVSQTYVIPLTPTVADATAPRVAHAGVGVAFSGARLDASAPTDAILAAHTLAPFDDCGGHVNLHVGYHIHAVTDKEGCHKEAASSHGHAPQIGLAMDGFPIHARLNEVGETAKNLDECRGHETAGLAYHYHANDPGANAILTCHTGETGCAQGSSTDECKANAAGDRRGPPPGERPPGGRPEGGGPPPNRR